MRALKRIPEVNRPLKTRKGEAVLQKTDIFKQIMWFSFAGESVWVPLSAQRVGEILELNQQGEVPDTLAEDHIISKANSGVLNNDLVKMDQKFQKKNHPKRRNKRRKKTIVHPSTHSFTSLISVAINETICRY